jgi:hypothetical protein
MIGSGECEWYGRIGIREMFVMGEMEEGCG